MKGLQGLETISTNAHVISCERALGTPRGRSYFSQ